MNQVEDPQEDIRADIMAAMEGASSAAPIPADVVPEASAEIPPEAVVKEPIRDEQGKFAKPAETGQTPEVKPVEAAAPPAVETSRPPHTLKATLKAQWASLPEDVRKEFERVESEAQAAKNEWQGKAEHYNKFEALIAPRREKLALAGVDEFTAIQQLLAAQDFLERDPQNAIRYLAQQFGVGQPGQQQPGLQIPQQQEDPRLTELQKQVATLSQTLTQRGQAEEQASKQAAVTEWMAFRDSPENPYAENVKEDMALLLREGRVQTLPEAYERAVWANPETRKLLMAAVPPATPLNDVRKAGLSINGAPGLGRQPAALGDPNASVEDDVRAAFQQVTGRV